MKAREVIAPERLKAAADAMSGGPGLDARIAWWLRHAHAAEHWLQFEWAFRLQPTAPTPWSVVCELSRVDIGVRRANDITAPLEAGLELKWYGNWWLDDLSGVAGDIEKVDNYAYPAVAVLFYLEVTPADSARHLTWLTEQTPRLGWRKPVIATLHDRSIRQPDSTWRSQLAVHQDLKRAELSFYAWYNHPSGWSTV